MIYVAFLRAINVGGHTVKMDRLRVLFEELALQNVSTFIASGNVIFEGPEEADAAALERRVDDHLERALGYEVGTFIRTPGELALVSRHPPFTAQEVERGKLHVCFLPSPLSGGAAERVAALSTPVDDLRVQGRELYWLTAGRLTDSQVKGTELGRALGVPTTMRNLNTVRRILTKLGG